MGDSESSSDVSGQRRHRHHHSRRDLRDSSRRRCHRHRHHRERSRSRHALVQTPAQENQLGEQPPTTSHTAAETPLTVNALSGLLERLTRSTPAVSVRDKDVPTVDPLTDDVAVWIRKIDEQAAIFGWEDKYICHLAVNKFAGAALVWYSSLTSIPRNWDEWKRELLKTFPTSRDLHQLMTDMLQFKAQPGANLFDYCFAKLALIRKMNLGLSGADEVNLIVGGLSQENLKLAIKATGICEPSELAAYLKSLSGGGATPATVSSDSVQRKVHNKNSKSQIVHAKSNKNENIQCFICNEFGHKQHHCPNRKTVRCRYCRRPGHSISECYRRQSRGKESENDASSKQAVSSETPRIRINRISCPDTKNKFFKIIKIADSERRCFIDFGSDCSLITTAVAAELELESKPLIPTMVLTAFGGAEILVQNFVTATVCIDGLELTIDLLLVTTCLPNAEIIIGQNFTEHPTVKYVREGPFLTFYHSNFVNTVSVTPSFTIGDINDSELHEFESLVNKYSECFRTDSAQLGTIPNVEMQIKVISDKIISQRPYRLAEAEKNTLRELLNELLTNGTIRPSTSPYASPLVLVAKPNGKRRLCVDYRAMNRLIEKEPYPLPLIEDLIDRLSGFKYFTTLDLLSGYHQIKLAPESIKYTAFITPEGKYEYLKVPFGLSNAPYVFQRTIDALLADLRFSKILVYLDDILIPSNTVKEGLAILEEVLQIFHKNNITLNVNKCAFFQRQIDYLGYQIENGTVRPSSRKVQAVETFPSPTNVHQLRQFLGLVGHFRKFVPNFAIKSKPLTTLLKKGVEWEWKEQQNNAFLTLKNCLTSAPILALYSPSKENILYTDACRLGIAGMLVQVENGVEQVIGYYSKHTTATEQRYHSFELECYAIVASVKRFRHYLFGKHFKIVTDCSAVRSAMSKQELNPRIGRWILELQEYNFEICHRPGTQMAHVDALSRNPAPSVVVSAAVISEDNWLLAVQENDAEVRSLKNILESGNRTANKDIFQNFDLRRGKVYRRTEFGNRAVIPKACRWQILRLNHDDMGHFAFDKTYELIASKFWFPKMRRFIRKYISNCINCLYNKRAAGKKPGVLHPIKKVPRPFHTVHLDHLGPFVQSKNNNTQVLVCIDAFTKFCFVYAVKNTKTKYVIENLNEIIKIFGVPLRIICDRGKAFTSKKFTEFCTTRGIAIHFNAVGMPRGNGQVERYNRTILESLAATGATGESDEWDENIHNLQLALNNTINKAIGVTPAEALFGYRSGPSNITGDEGIQTTCDVTDIRQHIVEQNVKDQERQKERFDKHRAQPPSLSVGTLVLVQISSIVSTGSSKKLVPKWKGPFQISKVLGGDRYEVKDIPGSTRSRIPYTGVYAIEHIKRWGEPLQEE